jgi:hypothetical protein
MLLSARSTLDRLLYGYLLKPHPLKAIAVLGNYVLTFLFLTQTPNVTAGMLCAVMLATIGAYNVHASAMGISTLWSFMYGYHSNPTMNHHLMYWLPCSLLVIPWPLFNPVFRKYTGHDLWPWSKEFFLIALVAHALFAWIGYQVRQLT